MKAHITKFEKGFCEEDHTFYRLQLVPENEQDKIITEELNRFFVVWVSPNIREKDGAISWWGKK